jgi:hypothetical protein
MITCIQLDGFKAQERTIHLKGPTLLLGPNGSGKSSILEGLVYALSGRVPAGKALDVVRDWFTPRGGAVRIEDSTGRWLVRGIEVDHARGRVSEILASSDTAKDAKDVDLTAWRAEAAVLDLREFLGLSDAKRREFVLRLCGGGAAPPDILGEIEAEYVREVAGAGAQPAILHAREPGLPQEIDDLLEAWRSRRGLREVLESHLRGPEQSLAGMLLALGQVAHRAMLDARAAGKEASAAAGELEAGAKEARLRAQECQALRASIDEVAAKIQAGRQLRARRQEILTALSRRQGALAAARSREADFAAAASRAEDPGPRPEPPSPDAGATRTLEELEAVRQAIQAEEAAAAREEALLAQVDRALRGRTEAARRLGEVRERPLGRVVALLGEIPDSAHPSMPPLRAAVGVLAEGWRGELARAEEEASRAVAALEEAQKGLQAEIDQGWGGRAVGHLDALRAEKARLLEAVRAADAERTTAMTGYQVDLRVWEAARDRRRDAQAGLEAARRDVLREKEEVARLGARLLELGGEAGEDLDALEVEVYRLEERWQEADRAAGVAIKYDELRERAASLAAYEGAWGAAEAAIGTVRERLVGASARPLVEDLDHFLAAAGRPERASLLLEDDRGRPCVDLGLRRDGERVSLPALSGAERCLVCAALSAAIARRSEGRRVVLVEADAARPEVIEQMLRGLAAMGGGMDAVLVATSRQGVAARGWSAAQLGM